jgi:hypothetical protein
MDRIGVLGKKDSKSIGTHVVYAPAPGKGARVRLFFHAEAKNGSKLAVRVNGIRVFATGPLSNNSHVFTSEAHVINTQNNEPDGSSADKTVEPYGGDYILGGLDSVEYTIDGTDFDSVLFQVVGVEVDV